MLREGVVSARALLTDALQGPIWDQLGLTIEEQHAARELSEPSKLTGPWRQGDPEIVKQQLQRLPESATCYSAVGTFV